MYKNILLGLLLFLLLYCKQKDKDKKKTSSDSLTENTPNKIISIRKELGDRLKIIGDFDGDHKIDTIYESYISLLTGKETFKILDDQDQEHNQELIIANKPVSRIYSNLRIDTFTVTENPQQTGIYSFENLGDINNDGKDELGYIIDWASMSNINQYHIISLDGNTFKEIFSFKINESVNLDPEELIDNRFLVKSIDKNTIKYKFYSDSATVETNEYKFE